MTNRDRLSQIQRGLIPGERYTARVRAVSRLGVKSEWSDAVDFTTKNDVSTPDPPSNLTLAFERSTLVIEWTEPTTNTDGTLLADLDRYVVSVSSGSTTAEYTTKDSFFLYTLEQNEKDFGGGGSSLTVTVKAVDTGGIESTEVSGTISNSAPLKPPDPTIDVSETTMTVTMRPNAADKDIVGYRVERSTTSGSGFTEIADTNSDSYFSNGAPSTTYYFRYRTVDFFGQVSEYSNEAFVTTEALHGRPHNSLAGLDDDDHTQYLNSTRHNDAEHSTINHDALAGLTDDDHTIYPLADGTRGFSGEVAGVDPTAATSLSTKNYVDTEVSGHTHATDNSVNTVAATGATEDISFNTEVHDMTMDVDCTFSFIDAPTSGAHGSVTVIVRGAFTPTWPASVIWDSGTEPTYSAPAVYTFMTVDGGTTVFGFLAGAAMA